MNGSHPIQYILTEHLLNARYYSKSRREEVTVKYCGKIPTYKKFNARKNDKQQRNKVFQIVGMLGRNSIGHLIEESMTGRVEQVENKGGKEGPL